MHKPLAYKHPLWLNPFDPQTFRQNATSGFLVFLVALPLCLAIANASCFPPIAGVITAIIGGLVTPWISNSEMTIKGPAAGLIVIVAGCAMSFGWVADNPEAQLHAYRCTLAVAVAAGVIQIAFALLRSGIVSEMFPTTVVHGMLSAIGIIIISKQFHIMLGAVPAAKEPLHLLLEIPHSITQGANPAIALIGLTSLAIMFAWPLLKIAHLKRLPAPLLVVALSIAMASWLGLQSGHAYSWAGNQYHLSDKYLVNVPANVFGALTFPDFTELFTSNGLFWVLMFCLIGSLESILSAKAVDLLDPARRKTNFDRDLLAVGVANTLAAFVGGLPMISEIVRSRANIDNGARNRFSNMFHGVFLLAFLLLAPGLLQQIPLAALAALLVYTGFRLASPTEFWHMYKLGVDQLIIFCGTVIAVLATDLLVGILIGCALKLMLHLLRGISWQSVFVPKLETVAGSESTLVKVQDSATFTTWVWMKKHLAELDARTVVIDLSSARLVDHTVMSKLEELRNEWKNDGRELTIVGLEEHRSLSEHPLACRWKQRQTATISPSQA